MSRFNFAFLIAMSYVLAPFFWWGQLSRRRDIKNTENPRFLVIPQKNRIGDIVCATPVLRAIKLAYPKSYLAVLVSKDKGSWEVLKENPRIDELLFYEDKGFIGRIISRKFDWSFALTNYPVASVVTFVGLIPSRVKTVIRPRSRSEILTDWLNNHKVMYEHHTYLPRHYLSLLKFIGIEDPAEVKEVFVAEQGEKKARDFFASAGIGPAMKVFGVSLTAGNKIKEWGDERFARLCQELIEKFKAKIILIGSSKEVNRLWSARQLVKDSDEVIIADSFRIDELPSLLKRLSLFISVDTGPLYMAHTLGVPVVDIVGPVDPKEQPPRDERSFLILPSKGIEPSSFVMKAPGQPRQHYEAVKSISVEDVLFGVSKLL